MFVDIRDYFHNAASSGWLRWFRSLIYYSACTLIVCYASMLIVFVVLAGISDLVAVQVGLTNNPKYEYQMPKAFGTGMNSIGVVSGNLIRGTIRAVYFLMMTFASGISGATQFAKEKVNITEIVSDL